MFMDERRFDALAIRVGGNRRSFLKKVVGIGGAAAVARLATGEAEAARRGYGGPGSDQQPNGITLSLSYRSAPPQYQNCLATGFVSNAAPNAVVPVELWAQSAREGVTLFTTADIHTDGNGNGQKEWGFLFKPNSGSLELRTADGSRSGWGWIYCR